LEISSTTKENFEKIEEIRLLKKKKQEFYAVLQIRIDPDSMRSVDLEPDPVLGGQK
jgi:hypothetical protein